MADPRKLTTRAVGVFLAASLLCLGVGVCLVLAQSLPDAAVLPARALPGELTGSNPVAWLSLGALLMILAPSARVAGMLLTFRVEKRGRAVAAAVVLLTLLLGNAATAIYATPPPETPTDGD